MARRRGSAGRSVDRLARWLLSPWLGRRTVSAGEILRDRPRRVLIVRAHDQIGDMVCATSAITAIRRLLPATRLTVVCAPEHEPVLRHNPDVDELLVFDRRRFNRSARHAAGFRRRLRALRPEAAFVLNTVSFSTTSALIAAGSGARWIVGGTADSAGWQFTEWLYSLEYPLEPLRDLPAAQQGPFALREAGFPVDEPWPLPVFRPGMEAERAADEFLGGLGAAPSVGLHPGAGKARNRWPARGFAEVIRWLRQSNLAPWILEGPQDRFATRSVLSALGGDCPVLRGVDLCIGAAALARSRAVLVNDSGPMHAAAAAGATGLALFGPTDSSVWGPPEGSRLRPLQAPDGTMESISAGDVCAALEQSIGRER